MIPTAFLLLFLAIPIGNLIASTWSPGAAATLTDERTWTIAALAVTQAIISTVVALVIGLPIAKALTGFDFAGRALTTALITVPFVMPTVVVAMAFRSLFGSQVANGLIIVVLAHAYINLAVVVRIVGSQWSQLDPRVIHVARSLGANEWQAFRTITLPALRPAVLTSAGIVFTFCFTSLGIVLLIGDSTTRTLESAILRNTSLLLDFPGAAALALVQLLFVGIALGAAMWLGRRTVATPSLTVIRRPLPRHISRRVLVFGVAFFAAVVALAPIIALVAASFRSNSGWTLSWWLSVGDVDAGTTRQSSPITSLALSVGFSLLSGFIASVVGLLTALTVIGSRWGRVLGFVALIPIGVSAATLGLGTLLTYSTGPIDLRATGILIPIAHSLIAIPVVVAMIVPTLKSVDSRRYIVAASLGASASRAFWTTYGPVLRIVAIAAGGLACAISLGEFGAASFLARAGAPTVPLQIARLVSRPGELSYGVAAVLAVILAIATIALVFGIDRLTRRRQVSA